MTSELKPCPFCLRNLTVTAKKFNPMAVCETDGCWLKERQIAIPCDDPQSTTAWNTRAVPDVPELVRYQPIAVTWDDGSPKTTEMVVSKEGEYVRYDQAVTVISDERQAAIDARNLLQYEKDQQWQERAEIAEAKLAQIEKQHDKDMEAVITERDQAEAWADKLARAIGGEEIGEHSNMNNPWDNALEIAESAPVASDVDLRAKLSDPTAILINMMRGEICKPEFDSLQRLYPEIKRGREALEQIAKQKLVSEISLDDYENAAFEDAYDMMIELSRAALNPSEPRA